MMPLQLNKSPYRIGCRAGQQGLQSPVRNQAGIEKLVTGTNSTHQALEGLHTKDTLHSGPLCTTTKNPTKGTRKTWTWEEHKDLMEAFYTASLNPTVTSTSKATYDVWQEKHPTNRLNLDANKLSNVRREVIKHRRLTDLELDNI